MSRRRARRALGGALSSLAFATLLAGAICPGVAGGAPRPDLVVSALATPPAEVKAGRGFSLAHTVRNRGKARAKASVSRFYLSLDPIKDGDDVRLVGSAGAPALDPGRSKRRTAALTVPASAPRGLQFVIACGDDLGAVRESNERNNCRAGATLVRIKSPVTVTIDPDRLRDSLRSSASNAVTLDPPGFTRDWLVMRRTDLCPSGPPLGGDVTAEDAYEAARAFLVARVGEQTVGNLEQDAATATVEDAKATAAEATISGLPGAALAAQLEAIRLDPADPLLAAGAAAFLIDVGEPAIALGMADAALLLDSGNSAPMGLDQRALALNNRGRALLMLRRWAEAEQALREALALDPFLAEARENLAQALLCQGRVAEANAEARGAATRTPADDPGVEAVDPVIERDGEGRPTLYRLPSSKIYDLSGGKQGGWPSFSLPHSAARMADSADVFLDAFQAWLDRGFARIGEVSEASTAFAESDPSRLHSWRFNRIYDSITGWREEPELAPLWKQVQRTGQRLRDVKESLPGVPSARPGESLPAYCGRLREWAGNVHERWRSAMQPYVQASRAAFEATYPLASGFAANVEDENAHRVAVVHAQSVADELLGDVLVESWGWANALNSAYFACAADPTPIGPLPEPGLTGPPACPPAIKAIEGSIDFGVGKAKVTCEKVGFETSTPPAILGAFASIEYDPRAGQTLIYVGGKAELGGSGQKSGLYLRLGEGQEGINGTTDFGWRDERTIGVERGPLAYKLKEQGHDLSYTKAVQDLLGTQPQ